MLLPWVRFRLRTVLIVLSLFVLVITGCGDCRYCGSTKAP